ncbi:alpha mannosidase-like protein [Irpex rosettiformis]|uniref:Alpha mannosidase-like protein n=1 Tax=Irpex rosettiformis TaxID=378272 RepID=A0ACB8UCI7_9APHY|nr:alpha mannosidase-like protein [Irpex rosettiformis]
MKWPTYWPTSLLLLLVAQGSHLWEGSHSHSFVLAAPWDAKRILAARNKTRSLWYHGYGSYMKYAFPMDELAPLSCTGRGPDWYNPANVATNDVAGNFSVTLVDVLDTLVVLNDTTKFEEAVRNVVDYVSFNVDTKPQVFETTIRVLGGLLSAHQYANAPGQPFHIPWYRGQLLSLAHDLGKRLLPAFKTPTGIPYARINLRHGLTPGETLDTCTAGAGSLILEFGTLSRLTGDERFEKAAYKAFFALWNQRSDINLVGNTVNIYTGTWTYPEVNTIGAGVDSFYEYALKWYILSGEVEFLDVFQEAYAATMRYTRAPDGFWYRSTNIHTGDPTYNNVDSLSAFWPGLQVLAGDVENAIQSHLTYWHIWKKFSGLPEVWDMNYKVATSFQYPLRPEFVESTWYLYRATRDPFYLDIGERILHDLIWRAEVSCGLTGISDLRWNKQDDRMESFVLSETLKYLYLLFDEDNPLHKDDSNYVLTTEGHILSLNRTLERPISTIRRELRRVEHLECPVYRPPLLGAAEYRETGLTANIYGRQDMDYSRQLIMAPTTEAEESSWSYDGECHVPKVDLYTYNFLLSVTGKSVEEDLHPGPQKLLAVSDGYILQNMTGIRANIVSRMDGKGYDVTKLGPYSVKTGQIIYVNDTGLVRIPEGQKPLEAIKQPKRIPEIHLRLFMESMDPTIAQTVMNDVRSEVTVVASTAGFAGDPTSNDSTKGPIRFGHGEGVHLVRPKSNEYGCLPWNEKFNGEALVVKRGECTFLEKLVEATIAGASGVITLSDEEHGINPSTSQEEIQPYEDLLDDVAIVIVNRAESAVVTGLLDASELYGGRVVMAIAPASESGATKAEETTLDEKRTRAKEGNRVLYLNNHPLLNTRLMI